MMPLRILVTALIAAALIAAAFFALSSSRPAARVVGEGWCCVQSGTACDGGYTTLSCRAAGGLAFSDDPTGCTAACASPTANGSADAR